MSNNLRQAAQAALEVMDDSIPTGVITLKKFYSAKEALRAALAEPQPELSSSETGNVKHPEPVKLMDVRAIVQQAHMALEELQGPGYLIGGVMHHRIDLILPKLNAAIDFLAAPQAQQPQPKPVACPYCAASATLGAVYYDQTCAGCVKRMSAEPQDKQPLTADQIDKVWSAQGSFTDRQSDYRCFARAIERAHGIGVKP